MTNTPTTPPPVPQGYWGKVLNVDEAFWNAVKFVVIPVVLVMLGINWWGFTGWQLVNILITITGYLMWWNFALKPTYLKYGGIGGALWNAPQNPLQGAASGIEMLAKTASKIGYAWLLVGFSLSTWSFSENPSAFPIVAVAVVILVFTGTPGVWRIRIITTYCVITIVVALWGTFNGSWQGEAFDRCTGESLYLVDPETGNVHSKRTPTTCPDPTYSPETGAKLEVMGREQALRRNPLALPTTLSWRPKLCSTDRIVIKAGDKITVSRDCPVVLNQIYMRDTSFRFELVDTNLQATAKDEQYISFTQEFPGKEGPHDVMLIPQRSMYDAVGKTELEIIITTPKVIRAPLGSLKPGTKSAPVLDPNKIN